MPNKRSTKRTTRFLWFAATAMAAGLIWYNTVSAPPEVSARIAFTPAPLLDPYPELQGVKIRINFAPVEELERLPGIGEKRARDIYEYIHKYGYITTAEQLTEISGLGETTIKNIRPYIRFD